MSNHYIKIKSIVYRYALRYKKNIGIRFDDIFWKYKKKDCICLSSGGTEGGYQLYKKFLTEMIAV